MKYPKAGSHHGLFNTFVQGFFSYLQELECLTADITHRSYALSQNIHYFRSNVNTDNISIFQFS